MCAPGLYGSQAPSARPGFPVPLFRPIVPTIFTLYDVWYPVNLPYLSYAPRSP